MRTSKLLILVLFILTLTACGKNNEGLVSPPVQAPSGTGSEASIKIVEDFGHARLKSPIDFNSNGVDDYADFLAGAKLDAKNHPRYDGAYVQGGYPSDDIGVCTDVIWRAFKMAGYSLKDMVDKDIAAHTSAYPNASKPDPNIDFRRVKNLHVFFKRYGQELTTDLKQSEAWMPGDIVIFKDDYHIGMISDFRADDGTPYVIHNMGQKERDENFMGGIDIRDLFGKRTPIAHYRFDASKVDKAVLVEWK